MADMIKWSNVVGEKTLDEGGRAGDLLELAMVHLEKAKEEGQLTAGQVGEIYATTIGMAFDKALQYELGVALREQEIVNARLQGDQLKFTLDNILPAQKEKAEEEVDLLQSQDSELLANGLVDREKKAKEILLLGLQKDFTEAANPKKLGMLDSEIESAADKAAMSGEQLAQYKDSRTAMLGKLTGEVGAIGAATDKVRKEIDILGSQYTAMENRRPKDLEMLQEQINKVVADTAMVGAQKSQLSVSVTDNRKIRSIQAQADMLNGITMAKLKPSKEMVYAFYKAINDLTGVSVSSIGTNGETSGYVLTGV